MSGAPSNNWHKGYEAGRAAGRAEPVSKTEVEAAAEAWEVIFAPKGQVWVRLTKEQRARAALEAAGRVRVGKVETK